MTPKPRDTSRCGVQDAATMTTAAATPERRLTGPRLRGFRCSHSVTVKRLSESVGLSESRIRQVEREAFPDANVARRLMDGVIALTQGELEAHS